MCSSAIGSPLTITLSSDHVMRKTNLRIDVRARGLSTPLKRPNSRALAPRTNPVSNGNGPLRTKPRVVRHVEPHSLK